MFRSVLYLSSVVLSSAFFLGIAATPGSSPDSGRSSQEPATAPAAGQATPPAATSPAAAAPAPQAPPAASNPTKNPVKATSESQAKAKKMYGFDCEMCHSANGSGKSDLAKDMQLTMSDLSDSKTLAGKSDGDIFDIIRKGKDKMPPEDPARAKDDDVWNLVVYVRSLSKNSTQASNAPN
jgi:cytochrome c5